MANNLKPQIDVYFRSGVKHRAINAASGVKAIKEILREDPDAVIEQLRIAGADVNAATIYIMKRQAIIQLRSETNN